MTGPIDLPHGELPSPGYIAALDGRLTKLDEARPPEKLWLYRHQGPGPFEYTIPKIERWMNEPPDGSLCIVLLRDELTIGSDPTTQPIELLEGNRIELPCPDPGLYTMWMHIKDPMAITERTDAILLLVQQTADEKPARPRKPPPRRRRR